MIRERFWRWLLDRPEAQRRIDREARGRAVRIAVAKVTQDARRDAAKLYAEARTEEARRRDEARGFWRALRLVADQSLSLEDVRAAVEGADADGAGAVGYRAYAINGVPTPPKEDR